MDATVTKVSAKDAGTRELLYHYMLFRSSFECTTDQSTSKAGHDTRPLLHRLDPHSSPRLISQRPNLLHRVSTFARMSQPAHLELQNPIHITVPNLPLERKPPAKRRTLRSRHEPSRRSRTPIPARTLRRHHTRLQTLVRSRPAAGLRVRAVRRHARVGPATGRRVRAELAAGRCCCDHNLARARLWGDGTRTNLAATWDSVPGRIAGRRPVVSAGKPTEAVARASTRRIGL
jgi:hypothetical protein